MEPKIIQVSINELDLKIIEKALLFLRANVDDYNEMMEGCTPVTEAQITKLYEELFHGAASRDHPPLW